MLITEIFEQQPTLSIIHVEMYDVERGNTFDLYTATDGNGNFTLAKDGSVWFTDFPENKNLKEVHGKPHSQNPGLMLLKADDFKGHKNFIGIFNENFKMLFGGFKTFDEGVAFAEERGLDLRL